MSKQRMPGRSPVSESESPPAKQVSSSSSSLVFISHDSRDAGLAEAFSKLLSGVSCGVLKSFRSSDHKTTQGIEYGVEWYPAIRDKLTEAGDVVALLTPRSFERPWILFETGIARGKLDQRGRQETKIKGLALGLPLSKIVGPFAQFQNCPFEVSGVTKLVMELVGQIPGAEPDRDAVEMQTKQFFEKAKELVAAMDQGGTEEKPPAEDASPAKLFEEVKIMFQDLSVRLEARITDAVGPFGRRKGRRLQPMMMHEMMHMMHMESEGDDPIGILMVASLIRDEMPWLYEIASEAYHALVSGDGDSARREIKRLRRLPDMFMRGPFREEFGGKEMDMMMMELPRMFEHMLERHLEMGKGRLPRKSAKADSAS
jgi:hypothetical protein